MPPGTRRDLAPRSQPDVAMNRTPLLDLDELLGAGIALAQAAEQDRPEHARNFRRIIGMLWTARDELDLMAPRPAQPDPLPTQTPA
jgi:hypothetical protein